MPETVIELYTENGPVPQGKGILLRYPAFGGAPALGHPPRDAGYVGMFSPWPAEITIDTRFSVYIPPTPNGNAAEWVKPTEVEVIRYRTNEEPTSLGVVQLSPKNNPDAAEANLADTLSQINDLLRERGGAWPQVFAGAHRPIFEPLAAIDPEALAGADRPAAEDLERPDFAEFAGRNAVDRSILCILLRQPD